MTRRVLLVLLLAGAAGAAEPIQVRVYHTNDIHGWIMPRPDRRQPERRAGGAAALAALIARDRGPKLVLDAGDWWQGTPEGTLTKGAAVADVFNAIGYDAVVIGNHEYDAGADALRALIRLIKVPVLSANTYGPDGRRVPWAKPWIVKEVAGVKFGVFGLTTSGMRRLAFAKNIEGLTFRREVDEARDMVRELKKAGATVIIAVTHVGLEREDGRYEGDQAIAREVPGIDLIVGGHSHTFLTRPVRDAANGTLITQAGSYLVKAGKATLEIDPKTRKVVASSDELVDLWPDQGEDPGVKAVVSAHASAVGKLFEAVLATATVALTRGEGESSLGDWMADCYRGRLGTDMALQNAGGIRADLPAGPVTLRSLFNVMPFDNSLVKLSMRGSDLRAVLEHGVGMERVARVSGAVLEYREGKPGERLRSAAVGSAPLDDAKIYDIATLDFLVGGGDGFSFDHFVSSEPTGALARDLLGECARAQGALVPPPAGRLILRED